VPLTPCTVAPELLDITNILEAAERRQREAFDGNGKCRVYWGTHGCQLPRGHDSAIEPHVCSCCDCRPHTGEPDDENVICVGRPPYYGSETWFYGEDV
jgi:hypothetical protein